jgi:uncharacterized membrane protein
MWTMSRHILWAGLALLLPLSPARADLQLCNRASYVVEAAIGIEEKGVVVTHGWYRIESGNCLKPDFSGKPRRLYSFAEAVDPNGQVIRRADKPLAWGGATLLCTRNVKFELNDHKDCAGKGLTLTGFAAVDLAGRAGATVRFRA